MMTSVPGEQVSAKTLNTAVTLDELSLIRIYTDTIKPLWMLHFNFYS